MELIDQLKRSIKVLAFDQYGTVVDMQSGLTEAVTPFLKGKGWVGEAHRFVTWWRRTHFENSMIDALCDKGHTPYREIGERAVSHVMDRSGIPYTAYEVRWLVGEIEKLKPFPDVVEALERLRAAGYQLAIISNGDRDMLEAARPYIGIKFDKIISVEESCKTGGLGTVLSEVIAQNDIYCALKVIGAPDMQLIEYGEREWFHDKYGLSGMPLVEKICNFLH